MLWTACSNSGAVHRGIVSSRVTCPHQQKPPPINSPWRTEIGGSLRFERSRVSPSMEGGVKLETRGRQPISSIIHVLGGHLCGSIESWSAAIFDFDIKKYSDSWD